MKLLISPCLLALALFAAKGAAQDSNGRWTTKDAWYRLPLNGFDYEKAREVPRQNFHQVTTGRWATAQPMLQSQVIVPLSMAQARGLTAQKFVAPKGTKPFLVRAVYLNAGTGGFSVSQLGQRLMVYHMCLGGRAVPMKRWALVVFLKSRPTQLFTEVSMAE